MFVSRGGIPMTIKLVDLTKLDLEALEAFFPSEKPDPKSEDGKADKSEKNEDEFDVRRRRFFGH